MTGASGIRIGSRPSLGDTVLAALWAGLVAGMVELATIHLKARLRHSTLLFAGRDVVWTTSVADAILFVVVVVLLYAAARAWFGGASWRLVLFALLFLLGLSPLLLYERLHPVASVLLAAGAAVQASRVLAPRAGALMRLVRVTVIPIVFVVGGWAVMVHTRVVVQERRTLASLSEVPAGLPNVLILILDTVRSSELSLYGYARPTTPELARWAASGIKFRHVLSPAPWTLPSHASMFTGRWPHELSADWLRPLDGRFPTLAESLTGQGYYTAGFVGNTAYCSAEVGLARGFAHYEDYRVTPLQLLLGSAIVHAITEHAGVRRLLGLRNLVGRKSAGDINVAFLRWLDRSGGRRFFAFLNYFDAHEPYIPPPDFGARFAPPGEELHPAFRRHHRPDERWSDTEIRSARDAYDASIAYVDSEVGALFAALERRALLENTLVILAGDHGEEFAEHGVILHGSSLYRPSVQVPLVIWPPGRERDSRWIETPVSLRDLPATVMSFLGERVPSPFPGRSLARFWGGAPGSVSADTLLSEVRTAPHLPIWYPVSKGDMYSITIDGLRYILQGDGREELYDFSHDAGEERNLIGIDSRLERLRTGLQAAIPGRARDGAIADSGGTR